MTERYGTIRLIISSVPKTLRASSNVTLRHKFLGRRSILVAVPDSHTPPPWPLHTIWSDVHVERPLGVKSFENRGVSPYCSCRAGSTELTLRRPYLASDVNSPSIHCAQTFLVQLFYYDSVRRTDTLSRQVMNCCFILRILYNSSFFVIWMTFVFWQLDKTYFLIQ